MSSRARTIECPICKGEGRIAYGQTTCTECQGEGEIANPDYDPDGDDACPRMWGDVTNPRGFFRA